LIVSNIEIGEISGPSFVLHGEKGAERGAFTQGLAFCQDDYNMPIPTATIQVEAEQLFGTSY